MIHFELLSSNSIEELSREKTLYISDFRSLGESFEYEIESMWKYENLLPWITKKGFCTVNESSQNLLYPSNNSLRLLKCEQGKQPSISIIKRLKEKEHILSQINSIWTAVPHPEIDEIARKYNIQLNYKYSDFIVYNDKISVKKMMGELSPSWHQITDLKMLTEDFKSGKYIIKRSIGAGGYTTFLPNSKEIPQKLFSLFSNNNFSWYAEEIIDSIPMSIQCYKKDNTITVFGYSRQIMGNEVEFIGAEFLKLEALTNDKDLYNNITETFSRLSAFLSNYNGFFGIDFFYDSQKNFYFLEINARMTALTIPFLLHNLNITKTSKFFEDYEGDVSKVKFKITFDSKWETNDIII